MLSSSTGCLLCDAVYLVPVIVLLYFVRQYIRGAHFSENVKADGKVAIVTGGSNGIGKALCEALNKRGAKVYMLCRDLKKAEIAKRDLIERGCLADRLKIIRVDLADFSTIKEAAQHLKKKETKVDILVNNAGLIGIPTFSKTVDGFEKTWQSNYLGHFLLTELLLNILEKSTDPRVVNVSSIIHSFADDFESEYVNNPKNYGKIQAYSRSKLANVMHARSIAFKYPTIKANSCHPGNINSNILETSGWLFLKDIFAPIFWFFFKTESDGAQTLLHLALSQKLRGNGLYYSDCAPAEMASIAKNDEYCEKLYHQSRLACCLQK